jgi:hypothetical protein
MRAWGRVVAVSVGCAVALLVLIMVLVGLQLRRPDGTTGDVGDMIQGASALFSGVAALAVVSALVVQIQQFRTNQAQTMRAIQIDLFGRLIQEPDLWPESPAFPRAAVEPRRRAIFTNLVLRYLELGIEVGYFPPEAVALELREQLRVPEIRELWISARPKYAAGAKTKAQRRFLQLMDSSFDESAPARAGTAVDGTAAARPPRTSRRRSRSVVVVGVALVAGIVIGRSLSVPRR